MGSPRQARGTPLAVDTLQLGKGLPGCSSFLWDLTSPGVHCSAPFLLRSSEQAFWEHACCFWPLPAVPSPRTPALPLAIPAAQERSLSRPPAAQGSANLGTLRNRPVVTGGSPEPEPERGCLGVHLGSLLQKRFLQVGSKFLWMAPLIRVTLFTLTALSASSQRAPGQGTRGSFCQVQGLGPCTELSLPLCEFRFQRKDHTVVELSTHVPISLPKLPAPRGQGQDLTHLRNSSFHERSRPTDAQGAAQELHSRV